MFLLCNYKACKIEYCNNYTISGSESVKSEGDDSEAEYDLDPLEETTLGGSMYRLYPPQHQWPRPNNTIPKPMSIYPVGQPPGFSQDQTKMKVHLLNFTIFKLFDNEVCVSSVTA